MRKTRFSRNEVQSRTRSERTILDSASGSPTRERTYWAKILHSSGSFAKFKNVS